MTNQAKRHAVARDAMERVGRKIVLLDIENVAGVDASETEFRRVWNILRGHVLTLRAGDLVIAGASHWVAQRASFALAGEPVQWRWRSGPDGADLALLDWLDLDHAARRFDELCIVSGDGGFAPIVSAAAGRNMRTRQIIGRGKPSAALWRACQTHTLLKLGAAMPLAA